MGIKKWTANMVVSPPWRKGGYAGFLTDKRLDIKKA